MTLKSRKFKSLIGLLMTVVMIVSIFTLACVPASAAVNENVEDAANGVFQIRTWIYVTGDVPFSVYKTDNNGNVMYDEQGNPLTETVYESYDHANIYSVIFSNDNYIGWSIGTAFLINDSTVLTCDHCVDETAWGSQVGNTGKTLYQWIQLFRNNFKCTVVSEYEIVVNKDVTISCDIINKSKQDDYAIMKLEQSLGGKKVLALADSSKLKRTQTVFSLGFPGIVGDLQENMEGKDDRAYDNEDVSIAEGTIQKITTINNTEVIQNGATIAGGNSGGPLVDERGLVVGVNKWGVNSDGDYYWATAINEVKKVLTSLNISFIDGEHEIDDPDDKDDEKETEKVEETEAPTEGPTGDPGPVDTKDGDGSNSTLIVILIIAGVVVIGIVIVVVALLKKKGKDKQPPAGPGASGTGAPVAPSAPPAPQPYNRPPMPPQGGYAPANDGAGETSVLNEGAGETTVLNGQSGIVLTRKSNGEKIVISKPEFIIGKERRRVDYCIADNNSISRAHAKLRVRSGRCYISDLGSTNCTYVNGTKLSPNQEVILSKGDVVKLSDEEFTFEG